MGKFGKKWLSLASVAQRLRVPWEPGRRSQLVWFQVRAYAWVADWIIIGCREGGSRGMIHSQHFFDLSFALPEINLSIVLKYLFSLAPADGAHLGGHLPLHWKVSGSVPRRGALGKVLRSVPFRGGQEAADPPFISVSLPLLSSLYSIFIYWIYDPSVKPETIYIRKGEDTVTSSSFNSSSSLVFTFWCIHFQISCLHFSNLYLPEKMKCFKHYFKTVICREHPSISTYMWTCVCVHLCVC